MAARTTDGPRDCGRGTRSGTSRATSLRLPPVRADAPYARGRSKDWLKLKCVLGQEFVIGGYGPREAGPLRYAGKVGTATAPQAS